jgi:hypothetical protein
MMIEDDQERHENEGNGLRNQLMGNGHQYCHCHKAPNYQPVSIRYLAGVATREIQY